MVEVAMGGVVADAVIFQGLAQTIIIPLHTFKLLSGPTTTGKMIILYERE